MQRTLSGILSMIQTKSLFSFINLHLLLWQIFKILVFLLQMRVCVCACVSVCARVCKLLWCVHLRVSGAKESLVLGSYLTNTWWAEEWMFRIMHFSLRWTRASPLPSYTILRKSWSLCFFLIHLINWDITTCFTVLLKKLPAVLLITSQCWHVWSDRETRYTSLLTFCCVRSQNQCRWDPTHVLL